MIELIIHVQKVFLYMKSSLSLTCQSTGTSRDSQHRQSVRHSVCPQSSAIVITKGFFSVVKDDELIGKELEHPKKHNPGGDWNEHHKI